MRNTLLLFSCLATATLFMGNQNGALPENTGAPGELTCGRAPCHNIPANVGTALISIKVADSTFQYQADSTYLIRVRITNPQTIKNGFQILALNASQQNVGQWILQEPAKTQLISGIGLPQRKYVTHKAAGNQQAEWLVKWKAPASNAGNITLYASVLSSNNNGANTGDQLYTTTTSLAFSTVSADEPDYRKMIRAYPNPVSERFWIENNSPLVLDEAVLLSADVRTVRTFPPSTGWMNLSVADLPRGIYLLKTSVQGRCFSQKLMIN